MARPPTPEPVDLLLFVEHAARELDVACAAAARLRDVHGVRVRVAPTFHRLADTLRRFEPRTVAVPFFMGCSDHAVDRIVTRWPTAAYVNLAFEQVYNKFTATYKCPRDAVARGHVLHHAWGPGYQRYLGEHGVPAANVAVNGSPVLSLYRDPYVRALPDRATLAHRHNLDPAKRWVFVPENYSFAFVSAAAALRRWGKKEPAQAVGSRQYAADSLRAAAGWWKRAAEALPGVELIVRPRPAVDSRLFARRLSEIVGRLPANLRVIKDGAVREWIVASDAVCSSFSTSLIEAAIARRPVYAMQPVPTPDYFKLDWLDRVSVLETEQQFVVMATGPDAPANWASLEAWAMSNLSGGGRDGGSANGRDAIAGLADLLADVCLGRRDVPPPPGALGEAEVLRLSGRDKLVADRRARWAYRCRGWLKHAQVRLGLKGDPYEKDRFGPADVADRVDRFAALAAEHEHRAARKAA